MTQGIGVSAGLFGRAADLIERVQACTAIDPAAINAGQAGLPLLAAIGDTVADVPADDVLSLIGAALWALVRSVEPGTLAETLVALRFADVVAGVETEGVG